MGSNHEQTLSMRSTAGQGSSRGNGNQTQGFARKLDVVARGRTSCNWLEQERSDSDRDDGRSGVDESEACNALLPSHQTRIIREDQGTLQYSVKVACP